MKKIIASDIEYEKLTDKERKELRQAFAEYFASFNVDTEKELEEEE